MYGGLAGNAQFRIPVFLVDHTHLMVLVSVLLNLLISPLPDIQYGSASSPEIAGDEVLSTDVLLRV